MTVSVQARSIPYNANGTVGPFAVPFKFFGDDELSIALSGVTGARTFVLGADYSVTGGEGAPGAVLLTASAAALAVAPGVLTINGATRIEQLVDYQENAKFPAEATEQALDRRAMVEQEQAFAIDDNFARALKVAPGQTGPVIPLGLSQAGKVLQYGPSGLDFVPVAMGGADSALRQDMANPANGPALMGFSYAAAYAASSIGKAFQRRVYVSEAPWNGDLRQCLIDMPEYSEIVVPSGYVCTLNNGPVVMKSGQKLIGEKGATLRNSALTYRNMIVNAAWANRATNGVNITGNLFWLQGEGALQRRKALFGGAASLGLQLGDMVWIDDTTKSEAHFTGSIAGTTLTVSATSAGAVAIGQTIDGADVLTKLVAQGSIAGNTLLITDISEGRVKIGQPISGPGIPAGRTITAIVTGDGGLGTYTISGGALTVAETTISAPATTIIAGGGVVWTLSQTQAVASQDMVSFLENENMPYRGVFPVIEKRGADVVVLLDREPTANPTALGTFVARRADTDISIQWDGVIDYNATQNVPGLAPNDFTRHAIILTGVARPETDVSQFKDTSKFCLALGASRQTHVKCLRGWNLFSDILKVYGPCTGLLIDDVSGWSGDDLVSIHNGEPLAFASYILTRGDIRDVRIRKLHLDWGASGAAFHCHIYPQGRDCEIDNIHIERVTGGHDGSAVRIWDYDGGHRVGSIVVGDLNCKSQRPLWIPSPTKAWLQSRIASLRVGVGPNVRAISGANVIDIDARNTVESLHLRDTCVDPITPIGQGVLLSVAGDIQHLTLENIRYNVTAQNLISFGGGIKTLRRLHMTNCELTCSAQLMAASNANFILKPVIADFGSYLKATTLFEISKPARVSFHGSRLEPKNFVINVIGGTAPIVDVDENGTELVSGNWLNGTGDAKFNPRSHGIVCGIEQAYIRRGAGNKATTTGTLGALPAGTPVTCDNSNAANSWAAIVAGAIQTY